MIDRRRFLLTSVAAALSNPLVAEAQGAAKRYRIGILTLAPSGPRPSTYWDPFFDELRTLGYSRDTNVAVQYSGADAHPERLGTLARAMVAEHVDVIVTTAVRETRAAKAATSSIPIVMTLVADPVGAGLIANLARPDGNVTGLTMLVPGLFQKYVEFLHEAVPRATRFAIVAGVLPSAALKNELDTIAASLGVTLELVRVSNAAGFAAALSQAKKTGASGLIVTPDVVTQLNARSFVRLAMQEGLPGIYWTREYVDEGGLMSYSADYAELRRRAAHYVAKLLEGVKPAQLPVEQPTRFELVINLNTAKALGLDVPPMLLARANEVIE